VFPSESKKILEGLIHAKEYGITFDYIIYFDDLSEEKTYYKSVYGEAKAEEVMAAYNVFIEELKLKFAPVGVTPEGAEEEVKPDAAGPQFIPMDVSIDKEVLINRTICEIDPFCPRVDDTEKIMCNVD